MNPASTGGTATGTGSAQPAGERSGRMYSDRMMAAPAASVSCFFSPAGIHSALVDGSTQSTAWVRTVSTPLTAQASW
jgi:hypothetical protein